jgi:hypothetical protein
MSTLEIHNRESMQVTRLPSWMAIDWAMRSLVISMHLCQQAGLDDILDELKRLHETARIRRDLA